MLATRAAALAQPPSEWALRELPARVAVFLRAVGTHPPLRVALQAGGYGPAHHAEGLRLLAAACPYREDGYDPTPDLAARQAAAELEAWAKQHLMRLRVALERLHPEALALFPTEVPEGPAVILVVGMLLERLAKLGAKRRGAPVLATLAERGLDDALRRRLATLVEVAKRAAPLPAGQCDVRDVGCEGDGRGEPEAELVALYRWYDDWTGTARALVARRDWLIRMGLGERRRRALGPP